MPQVTIKTGTAGAHGQEEVLSEYLCDWTDCANVAEHLIGFARELRMAFAVCSEHAAMLETGASNSRRPIARLGGAFQILPGTQ